MNSTIRGSAREVIYKVYTRCLLDYKTKTMLSDFNNVFKRTAEMTGTSESTVRRIVREGLRNNGKFSTPAKHRKGRPKKQFDNFNLCAIRQRIQFFYVVRKQVPTIRNLLPILREDWGYDGSHEHLRQVIKVLGFRYMKCQSIHSVLIEKSHIAAKRAEYLKVILNNRKLPEELQKDIIYIDECFVHQSHKLTKCWQTIDISGTKQSISKGKRYLIFHAGNEKGFICNALLIITGSNRKEECQTNLNHTNFTKWVIEKLIPNLPPTSIVVMDNAPYHSRVLNKAPTSGSKIAEIKNWLTQNQIGFEDTLQKPQLLMLVKHHKPEPKYEIDEILGSHGHTVVRLPPYHCDLNPFELIWDIAQHKIADQNVGLIDIKKLAKTAIDNITRNDWKKSCKRVMDIENAYYERELTLYQDIEQLADNIKDSSSTSSYSEMEDGSDFDFGYSPENMEQGGDDDAASDNCESIGEEYLDEQFLL